MNIQDHIRTIPDFPKPGINFYDIATLLANPSAWRETIARLHRLTEDYQPDLLMGIESRGFLVAAPLAYEMGCGFGMVRKHGKLPGQTLAHSYALEYGEDIIEIQPDLIPAGSKVVLVDDLLATGGTMQAAEILLHKAGAHVVANLCIIELEGLNGRDKLTAPLESVIRCPA
ncbi:MAG: adenine phosphoribosyltransferase [Rhodospirillales bacterium]|nr:adenine phosphoribosyltransferase [Alphaproteobacteria bacterium]MCB9981838.1 adenine phosphoribosyltransferase [Rhodospirillales bacterium]